jgi:hypothetical protein
MPPKSIRVRPNPSARGEDGPILFERLIRDGWQVMQTWLGAKVHWAPTISDMPRVMTRKHPTLPFQVQFAWSIDGYFLTEEMAVTDPQGWPIVDTGNADWLDWDQRGRLVVLRDGRVIVGEPANNTLALRELADFNSQQPEAIPPPDWATHW